MLVGRGDLRSVSVIRADLGLFLLNGGREMIAGRLRRRCLDGEEIVGSEGIGGQRCSFEVSSSHSLFGLSLSLEQSYNCADR